MSQRTKAAWVACAVIAALTAAKFILYNISGSLAVLSEAWHSIADVMTTMLVLISIVSQRRKEQADESPVGARETAAGEGDGTKPFAEKSRGLRGQRFYRWFRSIHSELKISIVIGLLLVAAAVMILRQSLFAEPVSVSLPLVTGIIFIGLSFGSYFLYRFEENIGTVEASAALKADSHHNRADMAISLMTGISLIIYHFGVDIDRWIGMVIALYILTFASELLVNSVRAVIHSESDIEIKYRFTSIIWRLFNYETYRDLYRSACGHFQFGSRVKRVLALIPVVLAWLLRWSIRAGVMTGILVYLSTIFYAVQADEKALLMRFGKIVNDRSDIGPGLHLKLPFPVDSVLRFKTGTINELVVGNTAAADTAMIWSKDHGDNRMFISGDNNLFLPFMVVHYRIKDVHNYYLTHRDGIAEQMLAAAAYRLLNQMFTTTPYYDLILHQRQQWTDALKAELQQENDRLGTGLEIVEFCLKDLHPPIDLAGSYEDVVAAIQLREKYLNDAERRVISLLSKERIQALKTTTEAASYVVEKKKMAEGESSNYLLRYSGYQSGGEVMKDLLFLKAAEKTLQNKKIYLIDPKSGIDDKLIYIENYLTGKKG